MVKLIARTCNSDCSLSSRADRILRYYKVEPRDGNRGVPLSPEKDLSRLNADGFRNRLGFAAQTLNLDWLVGFFGVQLFLHHQFLIKLAHHHSLFMRSLRTFHVWLIRPRKINFIQNEVL